MCPISHDLHSVLWFYIFKCIFKQFDSKIKRKSRYMTMSMAEHLCSANMNSGNIWLTLKQDHFSVPVTLQLGQQKSMLMAAEPPFSRNALETNMHTGSAADTKETWYKQLYAQIWLPVLHQCLLRLRPHEDANGGGFCVCTCYPYMVPSSHKEEVPLREKSDNLVVSVYGRHL